MANNEYSDFALLSLNEDPKNLSGYDPYYLGWDRITSLSSTGVVGIHHPSGDVKKIATSFNLPANTTPYWRDNWSQTTNGFSVLRLTSKKASTSRVNSRLSPVKAAG